MNKILKDIKLKLYLSKPKFILDFDSKINIIDIIDKMILEDMEEYDIIERIENLDTIDFEYNNNINIQLAVNTGAIESNPSFASRLDRGNVRLRFQFEGPIDNKNRDFCSYLMNNFRSKFFRIEDIDRMTLSLANPDFGQYSLFRYKGSFNCRHSWVAYKIRMKDRTTIDSITRSATDSSNRNPKV